MPAKQNGKSNCTPLHSLFPHANAHIHKCSRCGVSRSPQNPTDTHFPHRLDPTRTHASGSNGRHGQRVQCALNHRCDNANTEEPSARNKPTNPTPTSMCTTRRRWKGRCIAHPKWRSRSSLSIAPVVTSSISACAALEACAAKRGRLETSSAGGAWEVERGRRQKTTDECQGVSSPYPAGAAPGMDRIFCPDRLPTRFATSGWGLATLTPGTAPPGAARP